MSSKFHSSLVLYWARTENAHVKIDLKSRTLSGLGTDRRFVDFLSYFRTLSDICVKMELFTINFIKKCLKYKIPFCILLFYNYPKH